MLRDNSCSYHIHVVVDGVVPSRLINNLITYKLVAHYHKPPTNKKLWKRNEGDSG